MRKGLKGWIVLVLVATLAGLGGPAAAAPMREGPTDPQELETFLDGAIGEQLASDFVAGSVVTVVRDGEVLLSKGYGDADLERRIPVDPERTLFRCGSVSKLFVWTAVMQLVEQGKLDLHADVNTYLDFQIPATYPEPITLEHLMIHAPGFEDQGEGLFALKEEGFLPLEQYVKSRMPGRIYPPGQVTAYSNYGAALAGYIVQRVSGEPFEQYVERHIFEPLGMEHSTFRQPLPAALAGDMSLGYHFFQGGYRVGGFEFTNGFPAGSLSASGSDIARFMIAHLQDGRYGEARILQDATAQEMHRQHFAYDPRFTGMAYGFIESRVNGVRVIGHTGDTILFHSGLYLLPEKNLGVFVSYNSTGGTGDSGELLKAFMDRYYPAAAPAPPTPPADSASRITPYLGEYYMSRNNFSTLEKALILSKLLQVGVSPEGYLLLSIGGQTRQYVEVEPGLFRERYGEDRVLLSTDTAGRQRIVLESLPVFVFFKSPWYGTAIWLGVLVLVFFGLFLGAVIGWPVAFFVGRRCEKRPPLSAGVARWWAVLFGLLMLIFLIGFGFVMGDVNPDYGVPNVFFELPPIFSWVMALPLLLVVLGLGMVGFTILAWMKRYWGWFGRLHYTAMTLAALGMLGLLQYWNLIEK